MTPMRRIAATVVLALGVAACTSAGTAGTALNDDELRWCEQHASDTVYPTLIAQGVTEKDATLLMDDMNMRETGRGQQDQRWIRACQAAYRQR